MLLNYSEKTKKLHSYIYSEKYNAYENSRGNAMNNHGSCDKLHLSSLYSLLHEELSNAKGEDMSLRIFCFLYSENTIHTLPVNSLGSHYTFLTVRISFSLPPFISVSTQQEQSF